MINSNNISTKHFIGIFLLCLVPIIHNLHNFVFETKLGNMPVTYYVKMYYFFFAFVHSFAPVVGFIGAYLLIENRVKVFLSIPIAYEFYKSIEKIPFSKDFTIRNEFFTVSILFILAFGLLFWYFTIPEKPQEQKEFDKYFENTLKELNLKKK